MLANQKVAQIAATNSPAVRRVLREVTRRRIEEARRIGGRIAELRERHHLTQPAAAERMRVALRTYQTWEAGDAMPRWHNLQKIAESYGVTVDDILGNPPEPKPDRLDHVEAELAKIREDIDELLKMVSRLSTQASQDVTRQRLMPVRISQSER